MKLSENTKKNLTTAGIALAVVVAYDLFLKGPINSIFAKGASIVTPAPPVAAK